MKSSAIRGIRIFKSASLTNYTKNLIMVIQNITCNLQTTLNVKGRIVVQSCLVNTTMMPNFVLNQDKVTEFCSNASFLISSSENAATSLRWIAQHISQVIYLQVKFLFNSKCHTTKKFRQISGNKYTKKNCCSIQFFFKLSLLIEID